MTLASSGAAAPFSNLYFFGDSLTDAGSYASLLPPGTGRFTTNPGPVWAEVIGARYGFRITPSTQGGTDYAFGGARVSLLPGYPPDQLPTSSAPPIETQIQTAVASGIARNSIAFLWGGANDIFTGIAQLSVGEIGLPQFQTQIAVAATENAQQVATLQHAGARAVVFLNLPDIGATPDGISSGQPGLLSSVADLYNATALARLDAIGGDQIRFNTHRLFAEVLSNPALYGFTNVTAKACGDTPSLLCTSASFVVPNANETYFFADGVHPTTATHRLIAEAVASMIDGPAQMASLAEAPLAVEQANFRALDGRMWSELGTQPADKGLRAWASVDYAGQDLDGGTLQQGDGELASVMAGLDIRPAPNWLAGIALGYSENAVDFDHDRGRFRLDETSLTGYGGWSAGSWYLGGSLMLANLDYPSIKRRIRLGAATRTETSDTDGSAYAIRAQGGYWIDASPIRHGPFVKLTYQENQVNDFSETSADSLALAYDDQDRDSFITSLGWQAQGHFGSIRPYGRATWEHEMKDDTRAVTAHSMTLGGRYSINGYTPDTDWALLVLGAATDFGGLTANLSLSATAGKDDGDAYSVSLGVSLPL